MAEPRDGDHVRRAKDFLTAAQRKAGLGQYRAARDDWTKACKELATAQRLGEAGRQGVLRLAREVADAYAKQMTEAEQVRKEIAAMIGGMYGD